MISIRWGLHFALLLGFCLPFSTLASASQDQEVLKSAGIASDPESLLKFIQKRILNEEKQGQIRALVLQLGSIRYTRREQATKELIELGETARPFLKQVLGKKDLELARRARYCLGMIEKTSGAPLTQAVIRLLAEDPPDQAVETLMAFLPFTEEQSVRDVAMSALVAIVKKKPEALKQLEMALKKPHPFVKGAAAFVLGQQKSPSLQRPVRDLLTNPEVEIRYRAAHGLLLGGDKTAMPTFLSLLEEAPIDMAWDIEELLFRLTENPPPLSLSPEPKARKACRTAWETWWAKHEEKVDLQSLGQVPRELGLTIGVEYNTNRIWECNRQGRELWNFHVKGPMDAWTLASDRILVASRDGITERDAQGKVLRTIKGNIDPNGCQRLKNGNIFVSCYSRVLELTPDGKEVYSHSIAGSNAVRKHRNGNIIYAKGSEIIEIDTQGKEVRRIPLPPKNFWVGLEGLPGDRFLASSSSTGLVVEIDGKGKELWSTQVTGACGVERLPNGHTLIATRGRVVQVNREGKEVWSKTVSGYARRAHRR